MDDINITRQQVNKVWPRYRDNFPRHLLGVSQHLQYEAMHTLSETHHHRKLRLSFEAFIALIKPGGTRLTDIAEVMGISKQACNQSANAIEQAGYIHRIPDPADGRAKLLILSAEGQRLRLNGIQVVTALTQNLESIVGREAFIVALKSLETLNAEFSLLMPGYTPGNMSSASLGALLPRLSAYITQRLMELTKSKGHAGLKLSFGQVLSLIGASGARIQQIASIQGVSKQAISAIAVDLEKLNYIVRVTDPHNSQHRVLQFSDKGRQLIADSVECINELQIEFKTILGGPALKQLQSTFEALYKTLNLESDAFGNDSTSDINALAQKLIKQLGQPGANSLARALLAQTTSIN